MRYTHTHTHTSRLPRRADGILARIVVPIAVLPVEALRETHVESADRTRRSLGPVSRGLELAGGRVQAVVVELTSQ